MYENCGVEVSIFCCQASEKCHPKRNLAVNTGRLPLVKARIRDNPHDSFQQLHNKVAFGKCDIYKWSQARLFSLFFFVELR